MSTAIARDYGGETGVERLARRRRELIAAALDVGDSIGWRQLTVEKVASHARLSKRYFYEAFTDIDELAGAVVDDVAAGALAAAVMAFDDALSVPELAHAVLDALVTHLTDDPRRARVLFGELTLSESAAAHRKRAMRGIASLVVARARDIHQAGTTQDSIIDTTASLLVGGTGQAVLAWLDGDLGTTRGQLIDDLATLWMITGDGAAEHARRRAAATSTRPRNRRNHPV